MTVPVAGDWNGDGTSGIGTYTESTGTWSLRETPDAGPARFTFVHGGSGHYPVTGDWDANGIETVGLKVMAGTTWLLTNSFASPATSFSFDFGNANDLPLVWSVLR